MTLVLHLQQGKQRFVTLLALHDLSGENFLKESDLHQIIKKMKPSFCHTTLDFILSHLPVVEGKLDYQPLFNGDIIHSIKAYFSAQDGSRSSKSTSVEEISHTYVAQSTMEGEKGTLSTEHKEEEFRQFEVLLEFCKENDLPLNEAFAEKGKLYLYTYS